MALILASLRAKPNDIIISEHPGERFHPYCQSKLIEALFTKKKTMFSGLLKLIAILY